MDNPGAAAASRSRLTTVSSKAPRTWGTSSDSVPDVREERGINSIDSALGKCPKPQDVFHTSI